MTLRVSGWHKAGEGKPSVAEADQNTKKELRNLSKEGRSHLVRTREPQKNLRPKLG
jgi:hypothetical protein